MLAKCVLKDHARGCTRPDHQAKTEFEGTKTERCAWKCDGRLLRTSFQCNIFIVGFRWAASSGLPTAPFAFRALMNILMMNIACNDHLSLKGNFCSTFNLLLFYWHRDIMLSPCPWSRLARDRMRLLCALLIGETEFWTILWWTADISSQTKNSACHHLRFEWLPLQEMCALPKIKAD